jgi:seryl-tRNA synthetase
MLDPKLLRDDLDATAKNLSKKGYSLDTARFTELEQSRKKLQSSMESLQSQRNSLAKEIGQAKSRGDSCEALFTQAQVLSAETKEAEESYRLLSQNLDSFLLDIPNLCDEDVPEGKDEAHNVEIRKFGTPRTFDFPVLDHQSILDKQAIDSEAGAFLSGARFAVLGGSAAKLHRALAAFMMDLHTKQHGYTEFNIPLLVKPDILQGTGQLPKFADDLFFVEGGSHALIPTAEVPLTNLCAHMGLSHTQLPFKMCAHSACFRQEAGSYGKDTKGIFRQHQFEKVELVTISDQESSSNLLEFMLADACKVLELLELPYRVVSLCGGDLGFSAAKTYDIEVWIPSQQCYREISSCSNTRDFQARRMKARYKDANGKKQFYHTLNGSGVAIGRALIALLENHQQQDGTVSIPDALKPYC